MVSASQSRARQISWLLMCTRVLRRGMAVLLRFQNQMPKVIKLTTPLQTAHCQYNPELDSYLPHNVNLVITTSTPSDAEQPAQCYLIAR